MARLIRNTTILAKIESVYGTDPTPTGAANAILVSEVSINKVANNVARDLIRSYLGASDELVGTKYIEMGFTVEWQGSGTAATAPAWGPLLRACGFAESTEATPDRVEYVPVSTSFESVTIYYYLDGALNKATGCFGNVAFDFMVSTRPTMAFSFVGIDSGVTAASPSGVDYSSFEAPLVVTDTNVANLLLGCTEAAGTLSGGTSYTSNGFTVNMGVETPFTPLIGSESVDIVQRSATGTLALDLTAAQEVTMIGEIDANTTTSIGFEHGSVAGKVMMAFMPTVQRINPRYEDINGIALLGMDLRITPDSGNDEILIIQK
jgi:hypothetical protein